MNSKYFAEIKTREQAATVTADDILNDGGGYSLFSLVKGKFYKAGEVYLKSDAEFITHAHADIKALIAGMEQNERDKNVEHTEVTQLKSKVELLRAEVKQLDSECIHYRQILEEADRREAALKSAKDEINRYNTDCTKQCDKLLVQNATLKTALELSIEAHDTDCEKVKRLVQYYAERAKFCLAHGSKQKQEEATNV